MPHASCPNSFYLLLTGKVSFENDVCSLHHSISCCRHKVFDAYDAPISLSRDDVKGDSMSDAIK